MRDTRDGGGFYWGHRGGRESVGYGWISGGRGRGWRESGSRDGRSERRGRGDDRR